MNDYEWIKGQVFPQPLTAKQLAENQRIHRQQMQDAANRMQANVANQLVNPYLIARMQQSQQGLSGAHAQLQAMQAQQFQAAQQVLKPLPALEIVELTPEQLAAITGVP